MMSASEIESVLESVKASEKPGFVYFKDEIGQVHILDYIQEDDKGNIICGEYGNRDITPHDDENLTQGEYKVNWKTKYE